jgi:hypothetical protein
MPKNIEANTAASFVLSVIVLYLALVALYSTNLSIQSLSVNYAPELLFPEAGYGETPLSAADITTHSALAPDITRDPVTPARVPVLKRPPVLLVIFLLSLEIHLSLRPRWLLKLVMCRLLPSLESIIAFIASVPKFCLLSVFKILPRLRGQHRAPALAAARTATTSKAAPATRGAPGHGRSGAPIEAAALAAALAESGLESESEDKAGPWGQFTPSHLYDFDDLYDPDWGSDDDFNNPHDGDWLDFG